MALLMKVLVIAESMEELNEYFETGDWLWLKPSTGELFERSGGEWALSTTLSLADHSHPTHGDINFTGTISVDGQEGLTGSRTIEGHTLTFKNGILVGYEAP